MRTNEYEDGKDNRKQKISENTKDDVRVKNSGSEAGNENPRKESAENGDHEDAFNKFEKELEFK